MALGEVFVAILGEEKHSELLAGFVAQSDMDPDLLSWLHTIVTFQDEKSWSKAGGTPLEDISTVTVGKDSYFYTETEFNQSNLAVQLYNYLLRLGRNPRLKISNYILVCID